MILALRLVLEIIYSAIVLPTQKWQKQWPHMRLILLFLQTLFSLVSKTRHNTNKIKEPPPSPPLVPRDQVKLLPCAMWGHDVCLGQSVKLIRLNGLAADLWCLSLGNIWRDGPQTDLHCLGRICSCHQEGANDLHKISSTCLLRGSWSTRGRAGGRICSLQWVFVMPGGGEKTLPHTYTHGFVLWDVNSPLFNCINAGGTSKGPPNAVNTIIIIIIIKAPKGPYFLNLCM